MALGLTDIVALAVLVLLVAVFDQRRKRKTLRYPPGPPPLPIIGNFLDVPKEASWLVYGEWAKTYGEVVSLRAFGRVLVILNSNKAVRDLMDKRAAIYSDRPPVPFFNLMKWSWFLALSSYTDYFRLRRKILDRGLRPNVAVKYRPMQKRKVHAFLKRLLKKPEHYREHIEYLQGTMIMSLVYGYDAKPENDSYIKIAYEANEIAQQTMLPGSVLVNDLPFLAHLPEWLPGMGFKALAREGERLGREMVDSPFNFVKDSMRDGTAQISVCRDGLLALEDTDGFASPKVERAILEVAGSMYTVSSLLSLFFVLVLYPDVQKRAQAEVDAVTGGQRLPDYSDRPQLPFIEALYKEVLRWATVGPIGVPHATARDDVYEGYFIPKGAVVIPNTWAILHDPELYPDPDEFKPERYLTDDGKKVREDPNLTAAFGYGKRLCPGRHIADDTLFIVTALVVATYSIENAKDALGNVIPIEREFTGTIIRYPKDFKCSILPRSAKAEELIRADPSADSELSTLP
ncbi:cytochrome P450 [Artomyces pyxidatus]|uniref:Cytochrome P450 n=1 Tax=Artomyces pyxidatus TaxID=48021 RepID=A0ACB8SJ00_9AGAM|nr:cytochrome P450 [Artomyces pyxidatus]